MVINGSRLLKLAPIKNMETSKKKFFDTSFGLSEAGYDIRIKQNIVFKKGQKNSFTLASAIEEFQMPKNLVGEVKDKSSWARKGLSVFNTVIEPGWNGFLTLELVYHGNKDLFIKTGQGIAQVIFYELAEEGDYGNGKYQNQEDKPVHSR